MSTLDDEIKEFIVTELACRHTPQEIADMVWDQLRVRVDRRQVQAYDPERAGRKPADRWRTLFAQKRAEFDAGKLMPPIATRAFRMRALQNITRTAMRNKNLKLATEALEQAAKEEAGVYTNSAKSIGAGATISDVSPALAQQIIEEKAEQIHNLVVAMDRATMGYSPAAGETEPPADWPRCA